MCVCVCVCAFFGVCMCVCICVCVCVFVCMCVCICVCMYVNAFVHMSVCALHVSYRPNQMHDSLGDFNFFKCCSDTFPNLLRLLSLSSLIIGK